MIDVLIRAGCMIGLMLLGMLLRRVKLFGPDDHKVVSKIILNVTMPCMLVTSFSQYQLDLSLFSVILLGIGCNLILSGIGFLCAGRDWAGRAFNIINFSGFNIGCFLMPFAQTFFGPEGIVVACMFDAGNVMMCTGLTYGIASCVAPSGERGSLKLLAKSLFSSTPFITYLVLLLMTCFKLSFPGPILDFASIAGNANTFLAMFMIGLVFEFKANRDNIFRVIRNVGVRYGVCAVLAVLFYFLLPFPLVVRQVLVLAVFSPLTVTAPIFTSKLHGDVSLSGALNSICIPVSVLFVTVIMTVFQL